VDDDRSAAIYYVRSAVADAHRFSGEAALGQAEMPPVQTCKDDPYEQYDSRLRKEWDCFNEQLRGREVGDARTVAASLGATLAVWTGIGRPRQLLGVLIGLAKDFVV
jgi:hypothetical protein